jgi:hypothetical protein
MTLKRNGLYGILTFACFIGYFYLYVSLTNHQSKEHSVAFCFVKQVTNIPCPSCGSTRSIISITKGEFKEALGINPLGFVIALIMILSPIWIAYDVLTKQKSLFQFYFKIDRYLKKPYYAVPLILLILVNWIWNIAKG